MKNKGGELLAVLSEVVRDTPTFRSQKMGEGDLPKIFSAVELSPFFFFFPPPSSWCSRKF